MTEGTRPPPEPASSVSSRAARTSALLRLTLLRRRQTDDWQAGRPHPVEHYLAGANGLTDEDALVLIVGELLLRRQHGERPELAEYQRRFPHLAADLADQFDLDDGLADTEVGGPVPPRPAVPRLPLVPGFEVLGEIGHGGMGVVYKARQLALDRVVAVKMMKDGAFATPEEQARFDREATLTARLQHPNVAQVFGVVAHAGASFLVMEFVDGQSLAQHALGRPQPVRDAARLVETLARAIHAAHELGVVHRDLKPANVLLRRDGAAKIVDFGLAREFNVEAARTRTGVLAGTPAYMAPEQVQREVGRVGPAADVWALGVVLYELLTGRVPFAGKDLLALLEQVLRQEPIAPRRLRPEVPRDLEVICLKCLSKEPGRRYEAALELAEDLRRFQAGEPISARPAGALERGLKWARRRPAAAALLAFVVLAAAALAGGGLWHNARLGVALRETRRQRDTARANLDLALGTVDALLGEVGSERLKDVPEMAPVRQALLEKALTFCKEIVARNDEDPEARKQTAVAYQRVGDIYELMRRYAEAEDAFQQASALDRRLAAEFPDEPAHRANLAQSLIGLAAVYHHTHRPPRAFEVEVEAQGILEQLVSENPQVDSYKEKLADAFNNLGIYYDEMGRAAQALEAHQKARGLREDLAGRHPESLEHRRKVAQSGNNMGFLYIKLDKAQEAEAILNESISAVKGLRETLTTEDLHLLAVCHLNLGWLYSIIGKQEAAEAARLENVKLLEQLARMHPNVPTYQVDLASGYNRLAWTLGLRRRGGGNRVGEGSGTTDTPLAAYEKARVILEPLRGARGGDPAYLYVLGRTYLGLAWYSRKADGLAKAKEYYDKAAPLLEGAVRGAPDLVEPKESLGQLYHELGILLRDRKQARESEASYQKALALRTALLRAHPDVARYQSDLAWTTSNLAYVREELGRMPEALEGLANVVALRSRLASRHPLPTHQAELAEAYWGLGLLQERAGDTGKAEESLRAYAGLRDEMARKEPGNRAYALAAGGSHNNVGALQYRSGKAEESLVSFARSAEWLEPLVKQAPDFPNAREYAFFRRRNEALSLGVLGRDREAQAAWERALELAGSSDRPLVRLGRARAVAGQGEHAKAAAEAEEVLAKATAGEVCFWGGATIAACLGAAEGDGRLPPAEREAQAAKYAARAVELLRLARKAGYFKSDANRALLESTTALKGLRSRGEYKGFLAEFGAAKK